MEKSVEIHLNFLVLPLAHIHQFLGYVVKQAILVEGSGWGYDDTYYDNAA